MEIFPQRSKLFWYVLFFILFVLPFSLVVIGLAATNPLSLIMPLAVLGLLAIIFYQSRRKFPQETRSKLLFTCQGGGRLSSINYTFPFVRISIYDKFMVLAFGWTRYMIEREWIDEIKERRGLFGLSFSLKNRKPGVPPNLTFFPTRQSEFVKTLEKAGYLNGFTRPPH